VSRPQSDFRLNLPCLRSDTCPAALTTVVLARSRLTAVAYAQAFNSPYRHELAGMANLFWPPKSPIIPRVVKGRSLRSRRLRISSLSGCTVKLVLARLVARSHAARSATTGMDSLEPPQEIGVLGCTVQISSPRDPAH
jgi:hypothetical protein